MEGHTRLVSPDLAPARTRNWKAFDVSTMWMSVVHNLGQYTIAAGLYVLGMSPLQIFLAYVAAFLILQVVSNAMGIIGQRTGVPFPVIARISFGVFGANLPALIRGIVAVFWYGIQTYLAAMAMIAVLTSVYPTVGQWQQGWPSFLGLSLLGWCAFLLIWGLQLFIVTHGMERVRRFQNLAGPVIWAVMLVLAVVLLVQAKGDISLTTAPGATGTTQHGLALFGVAVFAIVASDATLAVNIGDFTRFSPSERSVKWGNFWGLPINGALFGIVAALCTAGAHAVYGKTFTDPADLIAHQGNKAFVIIGALLFLGATMATNIAANVVSPAYDFANLVPSKINFPRGALITSVLALLVLPWKVFSTPVIIVYFLGGVGAFMGPMTGIILWDYYRVRRGHVVVDDLYSDAVGSAYRYTRGFNHTAIIVLIVASAVTAVLALVPYFHHVAAYAWLIGVVLAAGLYGLVSGRNVQNASQQPSRAREDFSAATAQGSQQPTIK